MSGSIDDAWRLVAPVRVGPILRSPTTPARVVMVTENGQHLLRVDVHSDGAECRAFEDAILWQDLVIVGFGERVHAVSLRDHTVVEFETSP